VPGLICGFGRGGQLGGCATAKLAMLVDATVQRSLQWRCGGRGLSIWLCEYRVRQILPTGGRVVHAFAFACSLRLSLGCARSALITVRAVCMPATGATRAHTGTGRANTLGAGGLVRVSSLILSSRKAQLAFGCAASGEARRRASAPFARGRGPGCVPVISMLMLFSADRCVT
jgi:hypothetical protein